MTVEQLVVFVVLGLTLVLFVWGRWRYDVVAMMALLVVRWVAWSLRVMSSAALATPPSSRSRRCWCSAAGW